MTPGLLAIDQGTTSTRAILFAPGGTMLDVARRELTQHYPAAGLVEHDPEEIWQATLAVTREVLAQAAARGMQVAAIGVANQRETVVLWDRDSGRPLHRAIVWQDRRTEPVCVQLRQAGLGPMVQARTGLLLDPYFSATKLAWLLDHVPGARAAACAGRLAAGTIDTFLLWRLTGGAAHATDATNASRTLLFDIHAQRWDADLLDLFDIPAPLLPEVQDTVAPFGVTAPGLLPVRLPVRALVGDQQAALAGQGCFAPGTMKATYGTGCFALCRTAGAVASRHRMLTTPALRLGGEVGYAIEGAIFVAGAAVKWLRDGLGVIGSAAETEALAGSVPDAGGLYLVPAFVGLGAPYWDASARGVLCGLTLDAGRAQLVRACLEAVALQTLDLVQAMRADAGGGPRSLRVDGGMVANAVFCQILADVLDLPVERPHVTETTAWGAALLAGAGAGLLPLPDPAAPPPAAAERRFDPAMPPAARQRLLQGWHDAVGRALSTAPLSTVRRNS